MDIMKPNEVFLKGCGEIAEAFVEHGFKPLKKGQLLKKISLDKDITFEIYFQTSHRNYSANVSIMPQFSIYSNELKEWEITQTKNEKSGLIRL
jgi:TfoX/Sxy family transcriptional regulator of competence genes